MKIAQLAPLIEAVPPKLYGGTERVVAYLTDALVELGHEVTLFASGDSLTKGRLASMWPRSLRLDPSVKDQFVPLFMQLETVARRAHEFDVIHAHIDYFGYPLLRRLGVPSLTTLHGRLDLPELPSLYEFFDDVPRGIHFELAARTPAASQLRGHRAARLAARPARAGNGQGGYLAFLGRISPEKGPDAAIRIAAEARMPLKIAAKVDRVDQEYFKTTIEPLLGRGDVEFIGEIREDQKGQFLGNAAALLFPIAWREPFGLVMIESMACGTPVIAFENGSVPEVLEDGVTGFIVHDERQAAAAVRRAIALDRDRIRAEFERRFTARRMAQNYAAVYARLAKAFRRAGAVDGTGKQDKFPAHSLVTCGDAAIRPNEISPPPPRSRLAMPGWAFSNSYAALPPRFFARLDPVAVADPRLIQFNGPLATELGLGWQDETPLAAIFAGNVVPAGADPIATAYAGHQFGQFVPQLGDGRAILLGEVIRRDGARRDIQLKGSGRTPFSRGGDGRAALGPVLREYLVSESMHALGIPTTRALAAVTTGEAVLRGARLPGAILTRVAASHVRVGTFEYFAARGDTDGVRRLADYVIDRHYPELKSADRPYVELLAAVTRRQAALVAGWMSVGFIHGVMNTDNTAISGETIDFGPCAFMDAYDPATVFSSIDSFGRYAYGNQPAMAQWNMARFAETILTLIDSDTQRAIDIATPVVNSFRESFESSWIAGFKRKIGLVTSEDGDPALVNALLDLMQRAGADYTLTFRRLCDAAEAGADADAGADAGANAGAHAGADAGAHAGADSGVASDLLVTAPPIERATWFRAWRSRLARDAQSPRERARSMRTANPAYIPRNHRVEAALSAATEQADFGPFHEMLLVMSRPYEEQSGREAHLAPPLPAERVLQTFCGT